MSRPTQRQKQPRVAKERSRVLPSLMPPSKGQTAESPPHMDKEGDLREGGVEILPADDLLPTDNPLPTEEEAQLLHSDVIEITQDIPDTATTELPFDVEEDFPIEVSSFDAARDSSKELIPYDPLQAYLVEIRRHSPLSREEEHEAALSYFHHKDKEAAYRLVAANLWLVVKIARDYESAARNLLDLIQEGNIGLLEAVKNFDPYRQVRFPSYAAWWIKAYIIRYLIANWRLVKIGTTQAQRKLFFNLKREKEKLEKEGISPGPRLLAHNLNVKESEVIEMEQRLGSPDVSVDAPILDSEGEATLHGILPSNAASAEDLVFRQERQTLITDNIEAFATTLNDKEKIIFNRRLLADDEEKATLQEVSEIIHVSRERVRQIENRVKEKLKEFLVKRLGSSLEDIIE